MHEPGPAVIDRRQLLVAGGAFGLSACVAPGMAAKPPGPERLAAIEHADGGRLGVFVLDTGSGRSFGWRQDERFCHCSTFKLSLAALVLSEADAERLDLAEAIPYSRADLMGNSPVTEAGVARGALSVVTLTEAAQVTSDNAAANLLLRRLGGPSALTAFWRRIGDRVSRLDSYEPGLNVIPPGTEENSTTPRAMAGAMRRIVLGEVLAPASRARLRGWMEQTRTGASRIRAGLPAAWGVLDKTGTGMRPGAGNKVNDIAVLMPPGRAPIVVTGYYENPRYSEAVRSADEAVLKAVGGWVAEWAAA